MLAANFMRCARATNPRTASRVMHMSPYYRFLRSCSGLLAVLNKTHVMAWVLVALIGFNSVHQYNHLPIDDEPECHLCVLGDLPAISPAVTIFAAKRWLQVRESYLPSPLLLANTRANPVPARAPPSVNI